MDLADGPVLRPRHRLSKHEPSSPSLVGPAYIVALLRGCCVAEERLYGWGESGDGWLVPTVPSAMRMLKDAQH
jgi:hypothetical protein